MKPQHVAHVVEGTGVRARSRLRHTAPQLLDVKLRPPKLRHAVKVPDPKLEADVKGFDCSIVRDVVAQLARVAKLAVWGNPHTGAVVRSPPSAALAVFQIPRHRENFKGGVLDVVTSADGSQPFVIFAEPRQRRPFFLYFVIDEPGLAVCLEVEVGVDGRETGAGFDERAGSV